MAYTRGNPGDYDRWAQKGARGWSYADVLPYFRRCETWENGQNPWRGDAGPLGTEFAKTADPLYDAWLAAAAACGYPLTGDYNGKQQEGFGRGQYTIRDGRRSSTANAFLKPARGRKNLSVVTNAHTTRVVLDGTRAKGECRNGNEGIGRVEIAADQEPGDDGTKAPSAEPPLMQQVEIASAPVGRCEAQPCDKTKHSYKNDQRDPIDVLHGLPSSPLWLSAAGSTSSR